MTTHTHRISGQSLVHAHAHNEPHGYYGHDEDAPHQSGIVSDDPSVFPGTYQGPYLTPARVPLDPEEAAHLLDLLNVDNGENLPAGVNGVDLKCRLADAAIPPTNTGPRVEILVVRDPDSETFIDLWVDGQQISDATVEHVDPGAGCSRIDWEQTTDEVMANSDYTPDFRDAVVMARNSNADNQFIDQDGDDR